MGSYQDRKDIDELYRLIWNSEINDVNFATKEDIAEINQKIQEILEIIYG